MPVITWTKPKTEDTAVKAELERLQATDKAIPVVPSAPAAIEQCAHISRCGSQGIPNATIDGKPAYVCKVHAKKNTVPNAVIVVVPSKPRNTGGNTVFLKAYWAYRKAGGQLSMKDWSAKEKEKGKGVIEGAPFLEAAKKIDGANEKTNNDDNEPMHEPENKTICPNTNASHSWVWDKEQEIYKCDECGCTEDNQED